MDAAHDADAALDDALASCTSARPDANIQQKMCAGQCVNVDTDNANCGDCGQLCGTIVGTSCNEGACRCPAPQSVCGTQCVNMTNDSSNCGFCGHTCQGNPCTMGLCQASTIAQVTVGTTHLGGIAVDSTTVYWTQGPGPAGPAPSASPSRAAAPFRSEGRSIRAASWWTSRTCTGSTSAVPCCRRPSSAAVRAQLVPGIAVDAGVLRRVHRDHERRDQRVLVDSAAGTVNKKPLAGGPVVPLASGQLTPMAIAVDATNVYWVQLRHRGRQGSVNKVPIDTPDAVTPLASNEQEPSGIAIDG